MHPTRIDIPIDRRKTHCGVLNQLLAELFDLYSQTKQAHWTVRGASFYSLHKLFDELADTVEGQIDPLAERIAALGGTPRGTVRDAAKSSTLPEFPGTPGDESRFVAVLVERFAMMANAVRKGIDTTAADDAVTADLLTGMAAELDKSLWFLESHGS